MLMCLISMSMTSDERGEISNDGKVFAFGLHN